jgi:DNA-damage-inducible protein J
MASDSVVRARIDEKIKEEASRVLGEMGLSVSDAIRLLLVRIVREKTLPFDVRGPSTEVRKSS